MNTLRRVTFLLLVLVLVGCSSSVQPPVSDASPQLPESEQEALMWALDDEYKALATYDQVLADFGQVRPFSNIRQAEQRHIDALLGLFEQYGLQVPENTWSEKVSSYASVSDACEVGVAAEVANAALYDDLLAVAENDDVIEVFLNLQSASQNNHLPAFERCAGR